jgi:bifunctional DNase/RNase
LPIIIGAFEAQAIALELEQIQPPRPMTHDLLRETFGAVGGEVTSIVINELRDGTFFAKVHYQHDDEEHKLDSRPSDAVALAVRVDAPIYVTPSVLDEAGIPTDEGEVSAIAATQQQQASAQESSEPMTELERKKKKLQDAIDKEDYEQAAELRDEIQQMQGEEQEN